MLENKIDEVIYNQFEKNEKKKEKNIKKENNKVIDNIIGSKINRKKIRKKRKQKKGKKILNKEKNIKNEQTFVIDNDINDLKSTKIQIKKNEKPIINNIEKENNSIIPDKDNDYEMNSLSYLDAIKYDKRDCCEYYVSLLKNKQLFLFTFCTFNDYNSGIIKKFIFFLSFALHYTINTLFFTDSNMHQIYKDKGEYNFKYQLSYIIISSISSTIILRIILYTLILTDKSILKIKYQMTYNLALNMKQKILKCINIKFIIFFIFNFILLILFWFYLTCFNAKYENTQIYIIENTFISFGFSFIYPFIINIIPSFIRIYSIDNKSKDNSCLYSTSQIMQLL